MKFRSWKSVALCLAFLCALLVAALASVVFGSPSPTLLVLDRADMNELSFHLTDNMAVGSLYLLAGDQGELPEGWLLCRGQVLPRSDYPELFAAVGHLSTATAGVGSFTLPDLRGMSMPGYGLDVPASDTELAIYDVGVGQNGRSTYSREFLSFDGLVQLNLRFGKMLVGAGLDPKSLGASQHNVEFQEFIRSAIGTKLVWAVKAR